ncbi:hypothetical protein CSIRO_3564 [Bradyrhizobiaceae bacterium SG-6C]|nr:hypothetical protein CSIRO_3564 [Bradyrhizobiaceae bacterium SG-6C]
MPKQRHAGFVYTRFQGLVEARSGHAKQPRAAIGLFAGLNSPVNRAG